MDCTLTRGSSTPQLAKGLDESLQAWPGAKIRSDSAGVARLFWKADLNGFQRMGLTSTRSPQDRTCQDRNTGCNPDIVREAVGHSCEPIQEIYPANAYPASTENLAPSAWMKFRQWFPEPVVIKINWLLGAIRSVSEGVIRDFLEVVLSSIIREISQQDPSDLRIRRRKEPIKDADVINLSLDASGHTVRQIEKFWTVRGFSPNRFRASRVWKGIPGQIRASRDLGLKENSVHLVLTSPPYATALPYIDTDRLSLLRTLMGMDSSARQTN